MSTKPCLGRWRNKLTGSIYHDACTQTMADNEMNGQEGNEKTTQTKFLAEKFTNTPCNVTIQANYFPDARDRLVEVKSGSWGSSLKDPSNEKILESAVKIQRFYRAHRDRLTAIQPAIAYDSTCTECIDEKGIPAEPRCYRSQDFAILNRTSPRTRTDFELLYNLLDRWRINETEMASEHRFESSKMARYTLLLSKEVELLRGIDSLKTVVKTKNKNKTQSKFLEELSRPVVWKNRLGEPILVDTGRVQCARYLRDTFNALSKDDGDVPVQKRIKMLRRLRNDIEPHTCKPSNDLLRLLDQEIDLLTCDVDRNKLNWLRNRSKIAFLIFAREALEKDSEDAILVGRKTICSSCGRLLPVDKFSWEKRHRSSFCNYCLCTKNARTMLRIVYGPYERLLRDIRRSEAGNNRSHTNLAFVVDAKIINRLVNSVWHGKSAISECDRLDELRLVRLDRNVEWSPWNCLLLTANEASVHTRVENLAEFYGTIVLHKFHTRNLQAKLQFGALYHQYSRYGSSRFRQLY